MAPASLCAHGLRETSESAPPPLDLDLRLGLPGVVAAPTPRSGDADMVGLDHAPAYIPRRNAPRNGENYVEQWAGMAIKGGVAEHPAAAPDAPAPVLRQLFSPQPHAFDGAVNPVGSGSAGPRATRARSHEAEEQEAALELPCKRAKSEPPPPSAAVVVEPAALSVHHGALGQADAGATEPAWVRAELLPRLGLPADLRLHFVEDNKIMQNSDLDPNQNRFLISFDASNRLRAFLSAGELVDCGVVVSGRRRTRPAAAAATSCGRGGGGRKKKKKKRAVQFKYPGVPVLVHQRDVERDAKELKLNTFRSTAAMVVNGAGYRDIVQGNGFVKHDRAEVWAFRRPQDQKLCLVVAK